MSKLSEAMALMAGHEDSEGVAEFVLDTFRGRGKHDCGHGPMTVAEAREAMRLGTHCVIAPAARQLADYLKAERRF
jgi:hypothetical protein